MQGRYIMYGFDSLSRFLFTGIVILMFANFIIRSSIVDVLELILFLYAYFRLFSKNISKRYRENELFVSYKQRLLPGIDKSKRQISQAMHYHIYKCPDCGQKIRIPRGKGKIMVRCPRCRHEFRKFS